MLIFEKSDILYDGPVTSDNVHIIFFFLENVFSSDNGCLSFHPKQQLFLLSPPTKNDLYFCSDKGCSYFAIENNFTPHNFSFFFPDNGSFFISPQINNRSILFLPRQ